MNDLTVTAISADGGAGRSVRSEPADRAGCTEPYRLCRQTCGI